MYITYIVILNINKINMKVNVIRGNYRYKLLIN